MEIRNIAGMSTQELMACISEKKNEMEQKLKNGETEPTFSIGARSYTVKEWDKLIDKVDRNLDAVHKEQEQRREAQEKEALEEKASDQKEFLSILENSSVRRNIFMEKLNGTYKPAFPYEHLAKNGVISYHGVEFVCDAQKNAICLGDMSDKKNVLTIPLEGGGSLMVNRDSLGALANAITMFSPEDMNRIMRAIADDNKAQEAQQEIEEDTNSIGQDASEKVLRELTMER